MGTWYFLLQIRIVREKNKKLVYQTFFLKVPLDLKIDLESNCDELSIINIFIIIRKIVTWNRISLFNLLRSTSSQVRELMLRDTLYLSLI